MGGGTWGARARADARGWTALFALALWQDPHAANDSALLLAKSTYADGNQYVPNLFIRQLVGRGAGPLGPRRRLARRARRARLVAEARGPCDAARARPSRELAARDAGDRRRAAPGCRPLPRAMARDTRSVRRSPTGWCPRRDAGPPVAGRAGRFRERCRAGPRGRGEPRPGAVELVLRAPHPSSSLRVTVGGQGGLLRATGLPPLVLRPTGGLLDLPLIPYHEVRGRDGRRVAFCRTWLALDGEAVLRLGDGPPPSGATEPPPARARRGNGTTAGRRSLSQDSG